jgi:hypothetical protein
LSGSKLLGQREGKLRQADEEPIRRIAVAQTERGAKRIALRAGKALDAIQERRAQLLQPRVRELHLRLDSGRPGDAAPRRVLRQILQQRPCQPRHPRAAPASGLNDPDSNPWLVQEVTTRLPGRVNATETAYVSAADLESALRRAEAAHREHEKRTGRSHLFHRSDQDKNWLAWYAAYMVAEQAGTDLPS